MSSGLCAPGGTFTGTVNASTQAGTVVLSSLNNSLAALAEINSGWFEVLDQSSIRLTIKNSSSTVSLSVQAKYAPDATPAANETTADDLYTILPLKDKTFNFTANDQWCNIYVNNLHATNTADFYWTIITRANVEKPSTHKVNEVIGDDTDADLVKAVLTAQQLNDGFALSGEYVNLQSLPFGSLKVGDSATNFIKLGVSIPTGGAITIDNELNTESNVYDSGWLNRNGFHSQLTQVKLDGVCDVYLMNAAESNGVGFTGGGAPFASTIADEPLTGGAQIFQDYFRVLIVNTSGSLAEGTLQSTAYHQPLGSVLTSLAAPIFDFFVAPLTMSVLKAKNEANDVYSNVQSSKDDALFVANANRLSEVKGRSHADATGNVMLLLTGAEELVYTVPADHEFLLTNLEITMTNTINASGIVEVRDGGAGGTLKRQYVIAPSTNQTKQQLNIFQDYSEPIFFTEDVTIVFPAAGLGEAAFNIIGYNEPI